MVLPRCEGDQEVAITGSNPNDAARARQMPPPGFSFFYPILHYSGSADADPARNRAQRRSLRDLEDSERVKNAARPGENTPGSVRIRGALTDDANAVVGEREMSAGQFDFGHMA